MSSRSIYLTNLFLGRLSPLKQLTSICAHSFAQNWQLPFLNQRKGKNDGRKYFMSNLYERTLLDPQCSIYKTGVLIVVRYNIRVDYSAYNFFFFFFFFFFDIGFMAFSRIFHLYRADRLSEVGENQRTRGKITWPSISRTWLSHMWTTVLKFEGLSQLKICWVGVLWPSQHY